MSPCEVGAPDVGREMEQKWNEDDPLYFQHFMVILWRLWMNFGHSVRIERHQRGAVSCSACLCRFSSHSLPPQQRLRSRGLAKLLPPDRLPRVPPRVPPRATLAYSEAVGVSDVHVHPVDLPICRQRLWTRLILLGGTIQKDAFHRACVSGGAESDPAGVRLPHPQKQENSPQTPQKVSSLVFQWPFQVSKARGKWKALED